MAASQTSAAVSFGDAGFRVLTEAAPIAIVVVNGERFGYEANMEWAVGTPR